MPKIVDFDSRRREIAAKAVTVFVKDGLGESNLSKIAELCGFGRTTIYKYFRNKDEIFLFALDEIFSRVEGDFARISTNAGLSSTEKIMQLLEVLGRISVEDRDRMTLVLDLLLRRNSGEIGSGTLERVRKLRTSFEKVLEDGMAKGELKPVKASPMATTLFAIVEAYIIQNSFFDPLSYDDAMEAATIFLEGLKAK